MNAAVTCGPHVAGERAADRLLRSLGYRLAGVDPPSQKQIVAVLRALADHTALTAAIAYHHEPAIAVGRWLHDTADQMQRDGDGQ